MADSEASGGWLAQALGGGPVPQLPPPAERKQIRERWPMTMQQMGDRLGVKRETIWSWERNGAPTPRGEKGQKYAILIDAMRRQLDSDADPATDEAQLPGDNGEARQPRAAGAEETAQPVQAILEEEPPEPTPAPVAPTGPVPFDEPGAERLIPDGVTRACMRCGRPTSFLIDGEPRHLYNAATAAIAPPCWTVATQIAGAVTVTVPAQAEAVPAEPVQREAPAQPQPSSTDAAPVARRQPAAAAGAARRAQPQRREAAFADGPLAVLEPADGHLVAHLVDGRTLECPAKSVTALAAWALDKTNLGSAKLHHNGFDGDPLLVLTAGAAEYLGLPATLEDREGLRLDGKHKVVKQIKRAGWELPYRGFGPWPRVFQRVERGRRSVQLAMLPWGALEKRVWEDTADQPAPEIARRLGLYAERVLTPRGTVGVNSLELMTSLRPPTRAEKVLDENGEETGEWRSAPVEGSLQGPVDPAPPEPPDEHPLVYRLFPGGRPVEEALDEEACQWVRPFELVTAQEKAMAAVVGLDLITAFLAAANNVRVGLGPAHLVENPRFDKDLPGSWWADLSHIELDPRLPNPFTPSGKRPIGPTWYATPSIAYAWELGWKVQPTKAWVRPETGLYLTPWYERLRDAYLATMAELGVRAPRKGELLDPIAFLEAMARHKGGDPALLVLLNAIKATAKSGIGKLRERPQNIDYIEGETWPALDRALWRPDIRAAVISRSRINMHRKMLNLAKLTGHYPLAVLTDCVVYASPGPSPLDVLPYTSDGRPPKGSFALGVNPGSVKLQGTAPMSWALEQLEQGINIANYIGGNSAVDDGE